LSPKFALPRRAARRDISDETPPMTGLTRGIVAAALAVLSCAFAAEAGEVTLGSAAGRSGRYFGAALDPDAFDDRLYRRLAATQLTCVTPENAMKWASVEPARGQFDWRGADALVAFAKANRQKVRGHTLVWHSQLPPWLIQGHFSAQELRDLMVAHVKTEAGRYKGEIYAWDVVNEPFANDGEWRKSIWYEAMGPDYVAIALKAARAADPGAKLYINDYGVETAGPKMRALHDLVASLMREGVPIDGVGLQSHFVSGSAPTDLAAVMADFAALGVDVAVTELDLRIRMPASKQSLKTQADEYGAVVRACRATPRCVGVTTWGIADDRSWIPSFFSGYGAALPFDEAGQPKPAVAAMIAAWTAPAR
jgi:endo-1,4-beta-xylanase